MAHTTLISEEAGYRLKQAQTADGDPVELKVAILSAPSAELAREVLAETDYAHRLTGAIMNVQGGAVTRNLYSLSEVAGFMSAPKEAFNYFEGPGGAINYVNLTLLTSWLEETIRDAELASAVRDILAQDEVYTRALPFVKELLQERIDACQQALQDTEEEADT